MQSNVRHQLLLYAMLEHTTLYATLGFETTTVVGSVEIPRIAPTAEC